MLYKYYIYTLYGDLYFLTRLYITDKMLLRFQETTVKHSRTFYKSIVLFTTRYFEGVSAFWSIGKKNAMVYAIFVCAASVKLNISRK